MLNADGNKRRVCATSKAFRTNAEHQTSLCFSFVWDRQTENVCLTGRHHRTYFQNKMTLVCLNLSAVWGCFYSIETHIIVKNGISWRKWGDARSAGGSAPSKHYNNYSLICEYGTLWCYCRQTCLIPLFIIYNQQMNIKQSLINILLCYEPFITCLYPDEWETGGHVKETVKVQ